MRRSRTCTFCTRQIKSITALLLAVAGFRSAPCFGASCSASAALEAKLRAHPGAEVYTERGIWFSDHRQFGCAVEAFQKAFQMNASSAHLAYLLGQSLYSSGNVQGAISSLQQSVQLDPRVLQPHLILAELLDQTQHTMEAEIEWKAALAINPKSTIALGGLSKDLLAEKDYGSEIALLRAATESAPLTPKLSLDLALAYGQMGLLEDANGVLRTALHEHPSDLRLAKGLAAVLVLQSRKEEAAGILETAVKQHPGDLGVRLLYLRILLLEDDSAEARQWGRKLLTVAPNNWEVLYLNGVLERRAGEYPVARDHLEQAVALNPNHYESRHNLGAVLAQLKDAPGAKEQLEKAIALGDEDPQVRFELAAVLRTLGENQEAEDQLKLYQQETKAKSDLTQAAAKSAFADQKLAAGDTQQAIALYREALAAAPKEASLAYKLAMALDKAGDSVNERAALEQAIQIDPNMAEAQNQLGYLASRAGETASAEEHFRLAVRASPGYAKAWVNLAATLYLESKWPEARQAVDRALQLDPGNPKAQQLSKALHAEQTER